MRFKTEREWTSQYPMIMPLQACMDVPMVDWLVLMVPEMSTWGQINRYELNQVTNHVVYQGSRSRLNQKEMPCSTAQQGQVPPCPTLKLQTFTKTFPILQGGLSACTTRVRMVLELSLVQSFHLQPNAKGGSATRGHSSRIRRHSQLKH